MLNKKRFVWLAIKQYLIWRYTTDDGLEFGNDPLNMQDYDKYFKDYFSINKNANLHRKEAYDCFKKEFPALIDSGNRKFIAYFTNEIYKIAKPLITETTISMRTASFLVTLLHELCTNDYKLFKQSKTTLEVKPSIF